MKKYIYNFFFSIKVYLVNKITSILVKKNTMLNASLSCFKSDQEKRKYARELQHSGVYNY